MHCFPDWGRPFLGMGGCCLGLAVGKTSGLWVKRRCSFPSQNKNCSNSHPGCTSKGCVFRAEPRTQVPSCPSVRDGRTESKKDAGSRGLAAWVLFHSAPAVTQRVGRGARAGLGQILPRFFLLSKEDVCAKRWGRLGLQGRVLFSPGTATPTPGGICPSQGAWQPGSEHVHLGPPGDISGKATHHSWSLIRRGTLIAPRTFSLDPKGSEVFFRLCEHRLLSHNYSPVLW